MHRDSRWGLLVPAIVAACVGLWLTAGFVYARVELALCKPDNYSEGMCYGFEADAALAFVVNVFMALSVLVIELVAVVVAPSKKRQVALATFAVGSGLAIGFGLTLGEPANAASAVAAGLMGLFAILWWLDRAQA